MTAPQQRVTSFRLPAGTYYRGCGWVAKVCASGRLPTPYAQFSFDTSTLVQRINHGVLCLLWMITCNGLRAGVLRTRPSSSTSQRFSLISSCSPAFVSRVVTSLKKRRLPLTRWCVSSGDEEKRCRGCFCGVATLQYGFSRR